MAFLLVYFLWTSSWSCLLPS